MAGETVLVVDDEAPIRRAIRHAFEDERIRVVEAATGREGLDLAAAERPDLIVLDVALPDMVGLEVCREIRKWSMAPILVLSARHADEEKVALLDAGAGDYVTKPFSTPELKARARALLRRAHIGQPAGTKLEIGDLVMDLVARSMVRSGCRRFLSALSYYASLGVERIRLEGEAAHAEALRQADRIKDAFLASVSHDLPPLDDHQGAGDRAGGRR